MSEQDPKRDEEVLPDSDEEALRARFPDPETDARLQTPRGESLPEAPRVEFQRPTLPQADPLAKNPRLTSLMTDLRGMGAASTIGITLVASIAIGTGLGWLADKLIGGGSGTPWGLIIGFLLGTASGFVNLVRVANRLNRDEERRDR